MVETVEESVASHQVNNQEDYEEVIKPKTKRVTKPAPKPIEEDADDEMAFFNKLAEE